MLRKDTVYLCSKEANNQVEGNKTQMHKAIKTQEEYVIYVCHF